MTHCIKAKSKLSKVASHNNNNPFADNGEDSPWNDSVNDTPRSPYNPFTSTQPAPFSPSDLSSNDLIDLQQGNNPPQSPAQVAASSSRRQKPRLNSITADPSAVSSAHLKGQGKQKGKTRLCVHKWK